MREENPNRQGKKCGESYIGSAPSSRRRAFTTGCSSAAAEFCFSWSACCSVFDFSLDDAVHTEYTQKNLHQHLPVPLNRGGLKFVGAPETYCPAAHPEQRDGAEHSTDRDFLVGDVQQHTPSNGTGPHPRWALWLSEIRTKQDGRGCTRRGEGSAGGGQGCMGRGLREGYVGSRCG